MSINDTDMELGKGHEDATESILLASPLLTGKAWRRFNRASKVIGAKSPATAYHQLRIHGKRFRYAIEFITPVFGPTGKALSRAMAELQDVLGFHQDLYVAIQMIGVQGRREEKSVKLELGRLAMYCESLAIQQRLQVAEKIKPVKEQLWPAFRNEMEQRLMESSASELARALLRQSADPPHPSL